MTFHRAVGGGFIVRARVRHRKLVMTRRIVRRALHVSLQRRDGFRIFARRVEGHA
jgi:hypothetical protein